MSVRILQLFTSTVRQFADRAHQLLELPAEVFMPALFALQMEYALAIVLAAALALAFLVPYLIEEIRRGKVELGPRIPTGAGDTHPGTYANPAPGQPDAQADPYSPSAQRGGPEIKS